MLAALCLALPASVEAQMEFSLDEVDEEEPAPAEKKKDKKQEGDLIEQLAAENEVEGPDEPVLEREETAEEIYAVQQIYALRLKRFELAPSAAFTVNDPYLRHTGFGVSGNYWFTNVLAIGVNGVGKTTTIGKLASRFNRQDKSVLLAAGDTFRAAAVTQLEVWGRRVGCEVVKGKDRADPGSVIFDAIQQAQDSGIDVLIADTAGRLHTKVPLMEELKKLGRTVEKALGRPADHVLLVLDATTGQNAIQQAQLFKDALPLSGIVLTKLDGTAKGGVILGIVDQHQVPVEFIGIGERVEDLKPFDADAFVQALFESPEALEPAEKAQTAS